jgi:hypothetical protein
MATSSGREIDNNKKKKMLRENENHIPLVANKILYTVACKRTVSPPGLAYSNKSAAVCLFPARSKIVPPTLVPLI